MSHNIEFFTYPQNVDKKKVEAELNTYVAHADWLEGCSGLDKPIRWLDVLCDTEEKAHDYIKSHDRGWYDSLAVKFYYFSREAAKSKSYVALQEKYTAAYAKWRERDSDICLSHQKADYVGCKNCGSRLNRAMLIQRFRTDANFCPICRADLRSPTVLQSIVAAKARCEAIEKQLAVEQEKAAKAAKNIKWLVKIEYHT